MSDLRTGDPTEHRNGGKVDPVTGATSAPAANREPVFAVPGRDEAASTKMAEFVSRTGRRPNVVVILMDDVGWGDFGCYGGGVAVGRRPRTSTGWPARACCSRPATANRRARRPGPP